MQALYAGLDAILAAVGHAPSRPDPVAPVPLDLEDRAPDHGGLQQDLRALRVQEPARPLGFDGERYRSGAHIAYARACKRARTAEREQEGQREAHSALTAAWNSERLREGDKVGPGEQTLHPNQWDPCVVLSQAWKQLGKTKTLRGGLEGQHRGLDIMAAVAAAASEAQREYIEEHVQRVMDFGACPVIHKFYDCTPARLKFGRLQSQLMPHARYPVEIDGRWTAVPLEQYLAHRPHAGVLRYGVLEVLAQGHTMHYMDERGELHAFRAVCKPVVLQAGNASCLFSATEKETPCCRGAESRASGHRGGLGVAPRGNLEIHRPPEGPNPLHP